MLQKLNERIQGVVAWLVVILIGVTFTLFGVDYLFQSHHSENAKVHVNSQPLSLQSFDANYRRARNSQNFANMTAADDKRLQDQVLNQMIRNEVMIQAARQNGFTISSEQANTAIVNIPQFQQDGHFSSEKYQQVLSAALFTQSSFQNEVQQGMLLNQQRFAFMGSAFALPDEVSKFVNLYLQSRDYEYVTIKANSFIKESEISDTEISKYYKSHKKEFLAPEQVSLNYVVLSMNDIKKSLQISDAEARKFYDENQSNYMTPAQWSVAHILFAVSADASRDEIDAIERKANDIYKILQKNPGKFDQLVQSNSDDKLSLSDNGKLPWISAAQNEYANLLSDLTQKGQITAPARTKHGFEIFKLLDFKAVGTSQFSDVSSTIKEQLTNEMAQTKYAQLLEQLSDLSYQTPDTLEPVAKTLQLKIMSTGLFARNALHDGILKNNQLINTAFSHDVLDLGNNSEPIQMDNDSVAVIRLKEHVPEKFLDLKEASTTIKSILQKKVSESLAYKFAQSFIDADVSKQKQLLETKQLKWIIVQHANRDSEKIDPAVNELAFNIQQANNIKPVKLANGDSVLIKLKQINHGNLQGLDKEQKDSLVQQIEANYGTLDYDIYEKNLLNNALINKS